MPADQQASRKATLWSRVNPVGFRFAAAYLALVVAIFAFTVATTKPSNVGLDWIPFITLSMPWYWFYPQLFNPGFIVNAGLMYLLGTMLHMVWLRIREW